MANSRPVETTPIVQAILKGDLTALAASITSENINAVIDAKNNTALTLAAAENQSYIVDYLMGHAAINLKSVNQGTKALAAALDICDEKSPLKRQAILHLLANKIFHLSTSIEYIYILDPALEMKVGKINNVQFNALFEALVHFQSLRHPSNKTITEYYLERMNVIHAISSEFINLNCNKAADQWLNLQTRELNDLLITQDNFLEVCTLETLTALTPVMKLLIKIYQEQDSDVLGNNGFKITCAAAYLCAFKLGTLSLYNKAIKSAANAAFLHDALAMVEHQHERLAEEYVFSIPEMDKTFLQAYTKTHTKNYHKQIISEEKRLSNQLDYLVLLQPALERKSPEAKLEMTNQKDLMPKLLSATIMNNLVARKEYELEQAGLKNFYGIGARSDYQAAIHCFERAALIHENNSVNKAFNAYLLSIMVHYQVMITSHHANENTRSAQRALKNFRWLLPLYVAYFSLPYHVEVFELFFDFIKNSKDKTDRLSFINLLQKFIIKLASQPLAFKDELINHIFKKLFESKLLDDNAIFNKIISTLRECIKSYGTPANLFYKKFDLLDKYYSADKLNKAQREYAVMKARVDTCMETVDFQKNTYELNLSILSKALINVKLLPVMAIAAKEEFDSKKYSRVYLLWGETHREEPEKYNGFKQAVELGNAYALHALLRMPPRREYQISILHGLQNAIHREDSHSIEAVYHYLLNRNEFTDPLRQVAALAFMAIVRNGDENGMLTAASQNYIPALTILAEKQKYQKHMRRALYLSALLLVEFILNKKHVEQAYRFEEDKTLSIMNACMIYLCDNANTEYHQYLKLAAWYINLISAAQIFTTLDTSNVKLDVNGLLLYCAEEDGYYRHVRTGMQQSYATSTEEDNIPLININRNDQRFHQFYSVMQRQKDSQQIIHLHRPDIVYPEEVVSDPGSVIEMEIPYANPVNIKRSAFFANQIASVKTVAASFPTLYRIENPANNAIEDAEVKQENSLRKKPAP
jgi:hypothetical protein